MKHIDLRDGMHAELREYISHAADKRIRRARFKSREDPDGELGEDGTTALREFISSWQINDVDGQPIALEDADAMDRLPSDIADDLIGKILPLYTRTTVPNSPTPPSSDA
jgi:hypothetical protein